ncbi:hypothetical protein MU1_01170 [Paenibacillus glycanilyticus]|uniref:Uncharacterized protein n=1 Tax=Paenibacillus glycanilyticus TaxID=126569 RepID=A0ABQ6G494_9BACL|nr:hypothetical protein MU1_01170 [Paenibacillus glycanilyticus]
MTAIAINDQPIALVFALIFIAFALLTAAASSFLSLSNPNENPGACPAGHALHFLGGGTR